MQQPRGPPPFQQQGGQQGPPLFQQQGGQQGPPPFQQQESQQGPPGPGPQPYMQQGGQHGFYPAAGNPPFQPPLNQFRGPPPPPLPQQPGQQPAPQNVQHGGFQINQLQGLQVAPQPAVGPGGPGFQGVGYIAPALGLVRAPQLQYPPPAPWGQEAVAQAAGAGALGRTVSDVSQTVVGKKRKKPAAEGEGQLSRSLSDVPTVGALLGMLRTQFGDQCTNPVIASDLKRLAQGIAESGKNRNIYRSIQTLISVFEAHPNLRGPLLVAYIYSLVLLCEDTQGFAYLQQALNTEASALCRKEIPEKVTVARAAELELEIRELFEKKWEKGQKLIHEGRAGASKQGQQAQAK